MKKLFIVLALALCSISMNAQRNEGEQIGKIALSTYISDDEPVGPSTRTILTNKLNQIITMNGCAGDGFGSPFVVTAHLQPMDESTTATVPAMTAVNLGVTIFVGNGEDGTLFSSWYTEVTGVGDTRDNAWMAAIKKIPARNPELIAAIEKAKPRIVKYYESVGPNMIAKAKSAAKGGNLDEAISILAGIPSSCSYYNQVQSLMGQYVETVNDNANMNIISRARAAWSSDPTEVGASKAEDILATLDNPSAKVLAAATSLDKEMASRLKAVADREFAFRKKQARWQHELEMQQDANYTKRYVAHVNAAARVAKAYYKSRPRVVYHVHSWW